MSTKQTSIGSDERSHDHGTSSRESKPPNIVNSQRILPNHNLPINDVFKPTDSLNSPSANEMTVHGLADISIDQTFGSELGGVDDLLSGSFLASLQAVTPVHHTVRRFQSARRDHNNSNGISIEPDPVPKGNLSAFEDEILDDSLLNLNITPSEVYRKESSTLLDELNRKDEFPKEARMKGLAIVSDTPSPRETTSLASRLLKRFQTENRPNMADDLLCISGENGLIQGGNKVKNSTESSADRNKRNVRYNNEGAQKNESFTSISTQDRKAKPKDVIVLD